ncbi:MAG: hypothetical protein ACREYC_28635, partial [Gammaproteobacteria bacterium]
RAPGGHPRGAAPRPDMDQGSCHLEARRIGIEARSWGAETSGQNRRCCPAPDPGNPCRGDESLRFNMTDYWEPADAQPKPGLKQSEERPLGHLGRSNDPGESDVRPTLTTVIETNDRI